MEQKSKRPSKTGLLRAQVEPSEEQPIRSAYNGRVAAIHTYQRRRTKCEHIPRDECGATHQSSPTLYLRRDKIGLVPEKPHQIAPTETPSRLAPNYHHQPTRPFHYNKQNLAAQLTNNSSAPVPITSTPPRLTNQHHINSCGQRRMDPPHSIRFVQ